MDTQPTQTSTPETTSVTPAPPVIASLVHEPKQSPSYSIKSLLLVLTLIIFGLISIAGYLFNQNRLLSAKIAQIRSTPTTTPSQTPTPNETSGGQTYNYQQIFEIKIPDNLKIGDKGNGYIQLGDYFSIYINSTNPEDCRGDCSIINTKESKTVNNVKVRYLTGWWGEIGGNIAQSYVEYVIPYKNKFISLQMQELPLSTSSTPLRDKVGIVSEDNIKLLDQILSTFKFIDTTKSQYTIDQISQACINLRNSSKYWDAKYLECNGADNQAQLENFCNKYGGTFIANGDICRHVQAEGASCGPEATFYCSFAK